MYFTSHYPLTYVIDPSALSKHHALVGAVLSLFLADIFVGAARELALNNIEDLRSALHEMEEQQHASFAEFTKDAAMSPFLSSSANIFDLINGPSICHTARLPSQTRYLGHLTNSTKIGGPVPVGKEMYDTGIDIAEAMVGTGGELVLAHSNQSRRQDCHVTINPGKFVLIYFDQDVIGSSGPHILCQITKISFLHQAEMVGQVLKFPTKQSKKHMFPIWILQGEYLLLSMQNVQGNVF